MANSSSSGGVGFVGLLTTLFIGLKLTGHIVWSWWWILSPLWIPLTLALVVLFCAFVIALTTVPKIDRKIKKHL